jgi:competence protein ComEC
MKLVPKNIKLISWIVIAFMFLFFSICFIKSNSKVYECMDTKGKLIIHFIDVGQGDAILLMADNQTLLIDSGSESSKNQFLDYLERTGTQKLNYIIATHPHEDHIGNMKYVIPKYGVEKFYAPKITSDTDCYKSMVSALIKANKKITIATAGMSLKLGEQVLCEILAPNNSSYDNINNYSVVVKVTFNNTIFLLTGDAEKESEAEMLAKNYILKADVLKIGHHGSSTSTSYEFLESVNPQICIVSCGLHNSYGHPDNKILQMVKQNNTPLLRTDLDGNIVLESDGKIIKRK